MTLTINNTDRSNIESIILRVCINIFNIFTTLHDQYYWHIFQFTYNLLLWHTVTCIYILIKRYWWESKIQIIVNILCQSININNAWSIILIVSINTDSIIDRVRSPLLRNYIPSVENLKEMFSKSRFKHCNATIVYCP